jgi:uncharacterized protein with NRDE domain
MAFGLDPTAPLVVAANRDERLDRSATAMTVLRENGPRILGGRDEEAGGTWLAVNSHGLVAGLTNRPVPDGRDPAKRTRGELPLLLASHRSAVDAVEAFVRSVSPADYNPAWLLVGDRTSLFFLDLTGGPRPVAEPLAPGVHVLENSPLGAPSWKVDHVRALLGPPSALRGPDLEEKLRLVLADHQTAAPGTGSPEAASPEAASPEAASPEAASPEAASPEAASPEAASPEGRRPETLAACVHTDSYGTRSSTLIRVPAGPHALPEVRSADGHPCTSPFVDAGPLWTSPPPH